MIFLLGEGLIYCGCGSIMAAVNVFGADGKENSVLYHCPPDPTGHVIYFPGDTQVALGCTQNTFNNVAIIILNLKVEPLLQKF